MGEIKCPHCGAVFTVDETEYMDIVRQVRTEEFERELSEREAKAAEHEQQAVELAHAQAREQAAEQLARIKDQAQGDMAERDAKIAKLEGELGSLEAAHKNELDLVSVKARETSKDAIAERDAAIANLQARLDAQADTFAAEQELAVAQACAALEKERDDLVHQVEMKEAENLQAKSQFQAQLAEQLSAKEEIIRYKDAEIDRIENMKAKLNTKMVGERLEQHCQDEFNKIRAAAFPRAQFGKDNDASGGSKGDFIFREADENGNEFISIMFEMKNESATSAEANRHKNEDFFKKLDVDRVKKNCEYAVLVTLLESDSELYNAGIVDVSWAYPKMYVIRPQFFIPFITVLRNSALHSLNARRELAAIRQQNIDVTNFEAKLDTFKTNIGGHIGQAQKRFDEAIHSIDKAIKDLQTTRDKLVRSSEQLRLAGSSADDMTIRKLTYKNPTMRSLIAEGRQEEGINDLEDGR